MEAYLPSFGKRESLISLKKFPATREKIVSDSSGGGMGGGGGVVPWKNLENPMSQIG